MHQSAKLIPGFNSVGMIGTNELVRPSCSAQARKHRNEISVSRNDKMECLGLDAVILNDTREHTEDSFSDSVNRK